VRVTYAVAALSVLIDLFPLRQTLFANTSMFGGVQPEDPFRWLNLFSLVTSEAGVTVAFLAAGASMVALGLGIFPRASAAFIYLWVASYGQTTLVAQSGFDAVLRVVGFALVLGPQVTTWSVGTRSPEKPVPAYGLRLIQWQLMLIYLCTAWLKAPDPFWRSGQQLPYFLMSMFARWPTAAVAHHPVVGALATYATLLTEAALPFLLWKRSTRAFGMFLGLALHGTIALTSRVALFSLSMIPLYLAFLETQDFESVVRIRRWLHA